MVFKSPWIILLIPFVVALIIFTRRRQGLISFVFPSKDLLRDLPISWKVRFQGFPYVLRLIAVTLFLLALAAPRFVTEETIYNSEGIDIVLALDASGSMAAEDFTINKKRYNRLTIVKEVVKEFIGKRKNDRIGLIAFAGLAYTVCPLTTDYAWLETNLDRVELGLIKDGTAVGSAIISSLSRLRKSEAKSKIIILLTDGMSNAGKIDPVSAARVAQSFGIKIYAIGAGTKGYAPFPATDFRGRKVYQKVKIDLDEDTLKKIANITGGQYFRATDTKSLREIYKEIDAMEKTKIEEIGYFEYEELFDKVLLAALCILVLEIVLGRTLLLKIP